MLNQWYHQKRQAGSSSYSSSMMRKIRDNNSLFKNTTVLKLGDKLISAIILWYLNDSALRLSNIHRFQIHMANKSKQCL